jgi:late competence protein required for DNA uptake (superfamily II DNA/RNA helicase)
MDIIRSYVVSGATIYNCKNCTKIWFCSGSPEQTTKAGSDEHFPRQYPGMLEIQNIDISDHTRIWCLTCGHTLSEEEKTPCDAFFCPTCKVICPIVMKESL